MQMLKLPIAFDENFDKEEAVYTVIFDELPSDFNLIRKHVNQDSTLRKDQCFIQNGLLEIL